MTVRKPGGPAPDLVSPETAALLRQIADMRARGVAGLIDLPQLVVCGDQSVGKSSVLEGLTGFAFPKKDGLCTRFPTEILLEHSNDEEIINATIIPAQDRVGTKRSELESFTRAMSSFEELPDVTAAAGELMEIQGFGGICTGPAFAEDVLRIKVKGNIGLHLSVVDLPGMIENPGEDQTRADVTMVHNMVDSYAKNPRTIILAVVQASSDIANQKIITKAGSFDPSGQRTVGIITRTDLINKGTEASLARLARNEGSHKLALGFFLLKNPSPEEAQRMSEFQERHVFEARFFQRSEWKRQNLDYEKVGVIALRNFLQELLGRHIKRELPKIRDELRLEITSREADLQGLVEKRQTVPECRAYVTRLSMSFHSLVISGSNGHYQDYDPDFFEREAMRLRASIQHMNASFGAYMRSEGQQRQIQRPKNKPFRWDAFAKITVADVGLASEFEDNVTLETDPCEVSDVEFRTWVKEVHGRSKGKELPGDRSHVVLAELFHEQARRWPEISSEHLKMVYNEIVSFTREAIDAVVDDKKLLDHIKQRVESSLDVFRLNAEEEWKKLCEDERLHPITYNPAYENHPSRACASQAYENIDEKSADKSMDDLHAYYDVALNTFIDNVSRQVIERHLLRPLHSLFSPEEVVAWPDEELKIAAESPERSRRREMLQRQVEDLRACLESFKF